MELVTFYEQRQKMPGRHAPVAHHRAIGPGGAENLLAMDDMLNGTAMVQMQAQPQHYHINQEPATPVKQDRYGKLADL